MKDNIPGLEESEDLPGQMVMTEVAPPSDTLTTITKLSKSLCSLTDEIAKRTAELEALEAQRKDIAERLLPDLMTQVGLTQLALAEGRKISIRQEYYASIPKPTEDAAFDWMRANGMGSILKETLQVPMAKKQELVDKGIEFHVKATVHPMTLRAIVRETIEAGREFPQNLFGVHVANKAVVTS